MRDLSSLCPYLQSSDGIDQQHDASAAGSATHPTGLRPVLQGKDQMYTRSESSQSMHKV